MLHGFEARVFTECLHAYAFDVFFWKSPVSMFLKGFLEITHFQSRKHGTDGTLADQKQFDVSLRPQPIFFPKLVCD